MGSIVSFSKVSKQFKVRKQESWKSLFRSEYRQIKAISGLNFELKAGEIYGLIGENGAGKSTTIKLMTGILHPDEGTIKVLDRDPFDDRKQLMRDVGIIFGQRSILKTVIPVKYSLEWLKGLYGISDEDYASRLEVLSQRFQVVELIERAPRQLSLGQRRRCDLLAALLHHPQLILLDEPEIGLDYRAKAMFRQLLTEYARDNNLTVLISSHDLGSLEQYCTQYLVLHQGDLLFQGDMDTMRSRFSPKTVIRLQVHGTNSPEAMKELTENTAVHIKQNGDDVTLFVDGNGDLKGIIALCYISYHVVSIDIQSNSLEQILLEAEVPEK